MEVGYQIIHQNFKFNGKHYDKVAFCNLANELVVSDNEFEQQLGKFIMEWFDENDFIELSTSGTTGTPKMIQLKKNAMVNSAIATGSFFNLKSNCKALHCLPAQYIAGKMMLVRALVLGWDLEMVQPSSHPLDGNTKQYDFAAMVPLQVENSLENLHQIQTIIIGGAKLNTDLADRLKEIPVGVFETYGMTETITHIAAKKVQESVFSVLPGITIATDERNCLIIEAPHLSNDKIVTNDVVKIVNENQFVWLGRFDNVINSGGVKLFPERIEEKLFGEIPHRFFVIGKEDALLGEKLVIVIEGPPYEVSDRIFDRLDKYEKPKEILFRERFLETETGKIKRRESAK